MCTFGVLGLSCETPAAQVGFGQTRFGPNSAQIHIWDDCAVYGQLNSSGICETQECESTHSPRGHEGLFYAGLGDGIWTVETEFGQSDVGHLYMTDFGQSEFGQTEFGPN